MSKVIAKFASVLILLGSAMGAMGQNIQLREDHPDLYVVVKGDTLWDISGHFLENPAAWPQIWQVNPQIENPDLIYPGDGIALRYVDGQPVLQLQRGNGANAGLNPVRDDLPVVRRSPRIRREPLQGGIGELSLEEVSALLSKNRVVSQEDVDNSGYLLGTQSGTLLASTGDVIYARGDWDDGVNTYEIVQPERTFPLPGSRDIIGVELTYVGEARIISIDEEDVATLEVMYVDQEVRLSDRVIAQQASVMDSGYSPEYPEFDVEASVLGFQSGMLSGGKLDTVVLDIGEAGNIQSGHLLTIHKADHELRDSRARENLTVAGESFATVLVYRVFENASLGLVLNSSSEVGIGDRVSED